MTQCCFFFPRVPEAYATYLACLKAGFVIIPCSGMLRSKDLAYRVSHSQAKGIIAYEGLTSEFNKLSFEEVPTVQVQATFGKSEVGWQDLDILLENESVFFEGDTHKDDIAFLPYTSGTTGNPKAVVHTHAWHLRIYKRRLQSGLEWKLATLFGQLQLRDGRSGFGARFYR